MKFGFTRKNRLDMIFFVVLWLLSFGVRTLVYEREAQRVAALASGQSAPHPFVPFTIESAMAFNYAWRIASGELDFLGPDMRLCGLEKLDVDRQFNVGNEYFLGYGYRLKKLLAGTPELSEKDRVHEDDPFFSSWARFQLRAWASLATALLFISLRFMGAPASLAIAGALLHCVSPAAIARYTGQDIVGGAFALPFLMATYALAMSSMRRMSNAKSAAFCICAFASIAAWDMTQVVFSAVSVLELGRLAAGGGTGRARGRLWLGLAASVLLASALVPYHREHLLICSPLVIFLLPAVILSQRLFPRRIFGWGRLAKIAGIALCLFAVSSFAGRTSGYAERYSHFSELMKAKLRFGNVKPANPALLNFDARVLWTPAMHSADRLILKSYFPAALYLLPALAIFAAAFAACSERFRASLRFRTGWLLLNSAFLVFYLVSFFYIVRYHVFLALFMCLLLPQVIFVFRRAGRSVMGGFAANCTGFALWTILSLAFLAESLATARQTRSYQDCFYGEVSNLIAWCRSEGVSDKIFLADMEISPMLLAYCSAGIVLQPKFELGITRRTFEEYTKLLYHGTERDLMKFCQARSVDYYVYDKGLAGPMHIYNMRYFANAPSLEPNCPARLMHEASSVKKLRYFHEVAPPEQFRALERRYRVFKVVSDDNSVDSARWALDGREFLKKGNFDMARRLAKAAVYADPNNYSARLFYAEIYGEAAKIRLRGF